MSYLRLIESTTRQLARMSCVCSWCKCELPSKPCDPRHAGGTSGGICQACAQKLLADATATQGGA